MIVRSSGVWEMWKSKVTVIFALLFISLLCISVEAIELKPGVTELGSSSVEMADGEVIFSDALTGVQVSTTTKINDVVFKPDLVTTEDGKFVWGTGEKDYLFFDDPTVKFQYEYTGSHLKETIIIKEKTKLEFPITISPGSQIIPYQGGYRIIPNTPLPRSISAGFPEGVVIQKPYGIDANGNYVEMNYIYSQGSLILDYPDVALSYVTEDVIIKDNKSGEDIKVSTQVQKYVEIAYPLTIDPTLYLDSYQPYLVVLLHMNGTGGSTTFIDQTGKTVYNVNGATINTTVKQFGSGSGFFNALGHNLNLTPAADLNFESEDITVSFWIYPTQFDDGGMIWTRGIGGGQKQIRMRLAGVLGGLQFLEYDGSTAVGVTTTDNFIRQNEWNHIVGIRNNTGMYVYNSSEYGESAAGAAVNVTADTIFNLTIGRSSAADAEVFYGNLDEFALWKGTQVPIGELYPQTVEIQTDVPPVTTFTANTTGGESPLPVLFNETSTSTGTSWKWGAKNVTPGNNTWVQFSTVQNATYTFTTGNWMINLTSTNGGGSNISAQITWVNVTPDVTPPASITSLTNGTVTNETIPWTWTNPLTVDFNHTMVYKDGVFIINISQPTASYDFTGLEQATSYTISTHTVDTSGNVNMTWVNATATTGGVPSSPPVVNFTANVTTGDAPLAVFFTDSSTNIPTAWQWSYGDGSANGTTQNPIHSYTTAGVFTVGLTATNSGGSSYFQRLNYINVTATNTSTNTSLIELGGEPKLVIFRVQSWSGAALTGATVSVQGITTTVGAWGYIVSLLNIPLGEAPIENTLMTGTTDSFGVAEFMMIPTTKYNVTVTAAGYTIPIMYMYPHDGEYTIVANQIDSESLVKGSHIKCFNQIFLNATTMQNTAAYQAINVSYIDTTSTTTGGFINITQENILLTSQAITGSNMLVNRSLTIPIGGSAVKVHADVITSSGNCNYTLSKTFIGPPVTVIGISPDLILWVSMGLVILTALIATSTTSPAVSVIVVVEAWLFLSLGFFNPMVDKVGLNKVVALFSMATFIAIIWNLREGKRKETGR